MDDKEPTNLEAAAPPTGPPPAARAGGGRQWPIVVAVLALAVALVSLASLRGPDSTTVAAQPAALSNPLAAVPLSTALAGQRLAQPALPQAGAPAAASGNSAAGSSDAAAQAKAAKKTVEIMNYEYGPASLTVNVGDTVTWVNHDSAPHDVKVTDGPDKFASPTLQKGQSWSYTFKKAGKYSYYCSIHPDMKASVTAKGSGSTPPPTDPHEPPPSEPGDCASEEVVDAFLAHVKGAHLEVSPTNQVLDILDYDRWVLTHTVWLEQVLAPVLESDATGKEMLSRVLAHVDGAHLQVSPTQQVADILELDKWLKSHTVWISSVLEPALEQITC